MNIRLMPSAALETITLKKESITQKLIIELRKKFVLLKIKYNNPWRVLCEDIDVQLLTAKENGDTNEQLAKLLADILHVRQAVGEILLNGKEQSPLDGLKWHDRISWCKTTEDYKKLFAVLNIIENSRWKKCDWLAKNAKLSAAEGGIGLQLNGLIQAIREKHDISSYEEILRLRDSGSWIIGPSNKKITQDEYDEITRPKYYKENLVVRAVADFFQTHNNEK